MEQERKRKISAVVACYRDAPAIPAMYARLRAVCRQIDVDYEIIFVNDCSPDDARLVLAALAASDPSVVVVTHTRNFGSQAAFTSGMRLATGDAVVLLDGDLQDPPELLGDFVAKWRTGFDVVYGVRVRRETTVFLQFAYKAFYRVFRRLAYVPIPLDAGDCSLMDRRVVDVLNAIPESDRLLRGLRAWVGFRQAGVPYLRPERPFGRSTNNLLRNLGWARKAIFSFSYAPIEFTIGLGLLTVLGAFVAIAVQTALRLLYPESVPTGFTTLIVLMLFLHGLQMLSTSVLGCYIAHIDREVKRRPSYIVEGVLNPPAARVLPPTASAVPKSSQAA